MEAVQLVFKFIHHGKFLSARCHSSPSDEPIWHEASANIFQFNKLTPCVKPPLYNNSVPCPKLVLILNSIGYDFLLTNVLPMASCIVSRWKIRLDKILMRVDSSQTILCLKYIYREHLVFLGTEKKIYYFFFSSLCTELEQFANHPFLKLIEYTFVHSKSQWRSHRSDGNSFSSTYSPQKFTI